MTQYVGEIRMFAGNFAPSGWMFCDGALVPIDENDVLFNLIGTTYGGDGQTTFALPDLRGRVPRHVGSSYVQGESGGVESVTLNSNQIPIHTHPLIASTNPASSMIPTNNVLAATGATSIYGPSTVVPNRPLFAGALGTAGGSQPHDNLQPFLGINFIISLYGVYPSTT